MRFPPVNRQAGRSRPISYGYSAAETCDLLRIDRSRQRREETDLGTTAARGDTEREGDSSQRERWRITLRHELDRPPVHDACVGPTDFPPGPQRRGVGLRLALAKQHGCAPARRQSNRRRGAELAIADPELALCRRRQSGRKQVALARVSILARDEIDNQVDVGVVGDEGVAPRKPRKGARRFSLPGRWLPSMMRIFQPGSGGSLARRNGFITGASRLALPATSARTTAGSTRLTLSYRAVIEAGGLAFPPCAAACNDGRRPSATSDISSTTVENKSSRVYCDALCSSRTSFTHSAPIAR
jgi:hypothetical protein